MVETVTGEEQLGQFLNEGQGASSRPQRGRQKSPAKGRKKKTARKKAAPKRKKAAPKKSGGKQRTGTRNHSAANQHRLGDPCPYGDCSGALGVLSTYKDEQFRTRYLICRTCRRKPKHNKEITRASARSPWQPFCHGAENRACGPPPGSR